MRIATWNINSVRVRVGRLQAWLKAHQPDVLCLQEIKCTDDAFPLAEVEACGYRAHVFGQKTYNGVALLTRADAVDVVRGIPDGVNDSQSRFIAGTVNGVRIMGVYVPNGQAVDSEAYHFKLEWYARLSAHLKGAIAKYPRLVVCGDFNVAPADIDVHDPKLFEGQTLCTDRERRALEGMAQAGGLVDVYRGLHPEPGRYSWWDYRALGFPKNHGLRIDHVWASPALASLCQASEVDREERKGIQPSDHAPVWADFATE